MPAKEIPMFTTGRRESSNVEDRRSSGGRMAMGGGVGALLIAVVAYFLTGDPGALKNVLPDGQPQQQGPPSAAEEEAKRFVAVVLADTEDVWHELFKQMGKSYQEPKLVLFSGQVESACGFASSAVGPFYCPADQRVYLDLQFFADLKNRFRAPGDFAQAYVIAHEIGHHVQKLLGATDRVHSQRSRISKVAFNRLSVRLELQADFYAGVWAHHAQRRLKILEPGDIEEALGAANAIGDDRLQREAQGRVVPDSFTHGTSAQRIRWFRRGFETGDLSQGDTFSLSDSEL
jgi:predicted metalloprotease